MKKTTLIFLIAISFQNCFAQTVPEQKAGKLYDNYIGMQINGLITHVLNSSANSIGTGNPYLITYSMNSRNSGWGFRAGIGCNIVDNSSASTGGTTVTNNTDVQLRLGVEKTFELSKKWKAGTGVDLVMNHNDDNSTNSNYNSYDSSITTMKINQSTYGGGVFGKLNYCLTNRILVGTEGSFYYVVGKKSQTADLYRSQYNGSPTSSESKVSPSISIGTISLPIVIYVMVRF